MSVVTTGQITVTDQNDGVSAKLSLESFVAPTAPDGSSPVLTGASTTVVVFIGATDDSSNWVVSAAPSSGVTGTLSGRTYTVTGLTVDAGFVDLTASKNAYSSVTMRFAVSKAKKGNRGTVSAARAISASAWSNTEAATAISDLTSDTPVDGDVVTLYNSTATYSETRQRSGSTWVALSQYLNGNLVVNGTIVGDKLAADAVTAGKIAADAVEADKIKADAVVAGKIAANAVNAREIASRAITTEKMAIRSLNNLLENPDFENGAVHWTNPTRIINDPANALRGSWVYTYVSPNAANLIVSQSNIIEAMPGDSFYMRGSFKNSTGSSGSWYIQARFLDDANAVISTQNLVWSDVNMTWSEKECIVTAPANATRLRVLLYSLGSGTLYWDGLSLMKAADGKLIVDGSVVATKIAADAVTASHLNSDSLGVAGLAVFGGTLKSDDYEAGESGWRITAAGSAEFESLIVREKHIALGAVNDIERAYDLTGTSVSSTTPVNLLKMRLERFSDYALDLEVDCIFEASGNCMVVFDVYREGSGATIVEENVFQSIGGRISKASFLVTDFAPLSGLRTYAIRGRLAQSDARGGFNAPATIKQIQAIARQTKR